MRALVIIVMVAVLWSASATEEVVDLELALAVDASGSVDDREFALQLEGIAAGFRDAEVKKAIRSGPLGRIAINLVIWAEPQVPKDMSGWRVLAGDEDAERFAALVQRFPRRVTGATGIGEGIASSLRSMDANGITATREAVDVSGDGRETAPREPTVLIGQARAMAAARGVIVNGLAILNEEPDLAEWYARYVQTGPGSFVMAVSTYEDFAEAMRRKLLREIEYRPRISSIP
ncbi:MAG: DUF1194 domain-containing protein [Hyphomicrobiales bacterium]